MSGLSSGERHRVKKIWVAKDFSETPGGRSMQDGPYSGEEFRRKFLEPALEEYEKIIIYLDGTFGYPVSFLDEAFGELARRYSPERVLSKLEFIADEDPYLRERIEKLILEQKH